MKEELIAFETAVLAKEKGFNPAVMHYYHDDSDILFNGTWDNGPVKYNSDKDYGGTSAACSQSLLQRWLREVQGIHISVEFINDKYLFTITRNIIDPVFGRMNINTLDGMFTTYETALEAALQTALKLIV